MLNIWDLKKANGHPEMKWFSIGDIKIYDKNGVLTLILKLLDSAQILFDNKGNVEICAGLYTYAVEEYGKIVLLKKSRKIDGHAKIKYFKGFRDHYTKFRLGIKNPPLECTTLRIGLVDPNI